MIDKELEELKKNPPKFDQFKAAHDLFKYTDEQLYDQTIDRVKEILKNSDSKRDHLINILYYLTWVHGSDK